LVRIRQVGVELLRADRQKYMTKLIVAFRTCEKRLLNEETTNICTFSGILVCDKYSTNGVLRKTVDHLA